jgi:hypothetical protein
MGYSITVHVRDKAVARRLAKFVRANARPCESVLDGEEGEWFCGPYWADGTGDAASRARGGLSYIKRRGHLGFDYGCNPEYLYVILRWMAPKVGRRDPKTGNFRILYDDVEWFQIEPDKYDELGLPRKPSFFMPVGWIKAIRAEMERLDGLWRKEEEMR